MYRLKLELLRQAGVACKEGSTEGVLCSYSSSMPVKRRIKLSEKYKLINDDGVVVLPPYM